MDGEKRELIAKTQRALNDFRASESARARAVTAPALCDSYPTATCIGAGRPLFERRRRSWRSGMANCSDCDTAIRTPSVQMRSADDKVAADIVRNGKLIAYNDRDRDLPQPVCYDCALTDDSVIPLAFGVYYRFVEGFRIFHDSGHIIRG